MTARDQASAVRYPAPMTRQGNPKDSKWRSTPNAARVNKNVMLTLPPHMHKVVTGEAGEGGVSVAAVVRRILAAHYQIEDVPLVNPFKRNGGKRKGAGRKPATPRVYQAPSMPFVRIGRD